MTSVLTYERANECFSYDPATGVLTWKIDTGYKPLKGKPVGSFSHDRSGKKRLFIRIGRKNYSGPRVIWLLIHRRWPLGDVDHIDGDPRNNRISNLRECSRTQNMANKRMHKNNACGVKGVYWDTQAQRWKATVIKDRRKHHAGSFLDKHDAGRAYLKKAEELFGEFATDRRQ